jgi:dipeptidyl aminopeptidase/acylaminoacyl peptidase
VSPRWLGAGVKHIVFILMLLAAFQIETALAQTDAKTVALSVPAITTATFAQLPYIERPALSPDGQSLAGLLAIGGIQVVGISSIHVGGKSVQLRVPDGTQARSVRWVNNENIIVVLDALLPVEGDRWYISRLISVSAVTGKATRLLWEMLGQNGSDVLWVPNDGSTDILVAAQPSIYMGPQFWPTVFRVNVVTGRRTQVVAGVEGVTDWTADALGNVRTGLGYSGRVFRLLYRDAGNKGSFQTINTANTRKRETMFTPFQFLPGRARALVIHDDARGYSGIYETDLETQKDIRPVFVMPEGRAEVAYPRMSADGQTLLGVETTDVDGKTHWIDPDLAALQEKFDAAVPGKRARIVSLSADRKKMLVMVDDADMPGTLYYYDVDIGVLSLVARMNRDVAGRRLSPVKVVHYRARDGLEIEAVLTLPTAKSAHMPFIVMPHGGPWAQDSLAYDYWAQFLASKGYAVLQPNFRGSTGYGTEFLRKGEGQMGLAMQDDITDGVNWAVKEGIADESRVCIVGASYGGYAAMWGIVKDPNLYRCAISIAGVSSLRSEVNDFGATLFGGKYKDDWKRMTPNFEAVSPSGAVDKITTPLLLIHGKRDVTVDSSQSSQMFARMTKAGKTVEYVSLPLADHYFTRQADRMTLLSSMAAFLDKYNPVTPLAGK